MKSSLTELITEMASRQLLWRLDCGLSPGSIPSATATARKRVVLAQGPVALANKLARIVYALATKGGHYDDRPVEA